jgi:FkbM family methyltransferase
MRGGYSLFTHSRDFLSLWYRTYGDYEPRSLQWLCAQVGPGTALLDIGANMGALSLALATRLPEARVICFEPHPGTYALLSRSIAHNGLGDRVTAFENALGDECASREFIQNPEDSGDSVIAEGNLHPPGGTRTRVNVVRLDEFAPFTGLAKAVPVACVKMDIQGAEVFAVRGMREFLREQRPTLLVELAPECLRRFGHTERDLLEALQAAGYAVTDRIDGNLVARFEMPAPLPSPLHGHS